MISDKLLKPFLGGENGVEGLTLAREFKNISDKLDALHADHLKLQAQHKELENQHKALLEQHKEMLAQHGERDESNQSLVKSYGETADAAMAERGAVFGQLQATSKKFQELAQELTDYIEVHKKEFMY